MKPSGIEWIGDIPDDWEVRKITTLLDNIGSGTTPPNNTDFYENGIIPWLNTGDLTDNYVDLIENKITEYAVNQYSALKIFPKDSVVIAMYGATIGKLGILRESASTNQACCVMQCNDNLYFKFLFYSLYGYREYILTLSYGSGQPNISQKIIKDLRLPTPPLKTQQIIADYLDEKCGEIDATIAKQKESIEKLKAYKQSLISETVIKGLDKSAPLKPSGIEWIGDIPDDWEVRKLLSIFKEHKDRNKNLEEQNLLSLSYGKIKRKDINNNDGLLPASFETYNIVENGDIVFRLTDLQNDKRSLRTGIVTQRGIITSAYVTIRPKIRLDSRFFHYLYHMYDICKVFYGMGDGVRQGMGFEDLKNIPTLIPPLKTQQKIADYLDSKCSQIDKYITEKQNIIQKLDAYKKSLIFECVTGKTEL